MKPFKESQLYSILFNKCPRCHEGAFYRITNPYKAFFKKEVLHNVCSVCGQPFEPETGFYYGAMFVSYAINVLAFVIVWALIQFLAPADFPIPYTVGIIAVALILAAPLSLYYSRSVWLAFFVRYRKAGKNT